MRNEFAGGRAGVLNTDNLSILGLTLDYGPYGFMDTCVPLLSFRCVSARKLCKRSSLNQEVTHELPPSHYGVS